jgi:hypothetical protein
MRSKLAYTPSGLTGAAGSSLRLLLDGGGLDHDQRLRLGLLAVRLVLLGAHLLTELLEFVLGRLVIVLVTGGAVG